MKKANKISGYLIMTFLIAMASIAIYKGYQIRHHFAITVGKISEITLPGYKSSGDYSILFEYAVNGEIYHGNNNPFFCKGQTRAQIRSLLLGKQFPVAYAIKSPSAGTMLLTQHNADRFKYTLPDSVRVFDSVLTCK